MNSYSLYFLSVHWTDHGPSQTDGDFPIPSWTGLWHRPKWSDRYVRADMVRDSEHWRIDLTKWMLPFYIQNAYFKYQSVPSHVRPWRTVLRESMFKVRT